MRLINLLYNKSINNNNNNNSKNRYNKYNTSKIKI